MAWPANSARTKNWGTEILTDTDLESEFDLLHGYINDMMNSSSGHKHDGTTAEGPKIITANINDAAGTAGDVFYSDGSSLTRLAVGTAGQALVVNSGATAPEWGAAATFASAAEVLTGTEAAKSIAPDTFVAHQGAVKGWISFVGTGTIAINDSFIVDTGTGLTDNGTGDYTIPWDTDFGSSNYACAGMGQRVSGTTFSDVCFDKDTGPAAGTLRVETGEGATLVDCPLVTIIAIGDR